MFFTTTVILYKSPIAVISSVFCFLIFCFAVNVSFEASFKCPSKLILSPFDKELVTLTFPLVSFSFTISKTNPVLLLSTIIGIVPGSLPLFLPVKLSSNSILTKFFVELLAAL